MDASDVKALVFDVFGTVVDWRSSIIEEGQRLGAAKGIKADWEPFAVARQIPANDGQCTPGRVAMDQPGCAAPNELG